MKFKYRYLRDLSGSDGDYIRLPLLQVRLSYRTEISGFFDRYEIGFQRYRGRFEIKSRLLLNH
jgi:hypothetical protein